MAGSPGDGLGDGTGCRNPGFCCPDDPCIGNRGHPGSKNPGMSCSFGNNLSGSVCMAAGLVCRLAHLSDSGDGVLDLREGGPSVILSRFLYWTECLLCSDV